VLPARGTMAQEHCAPVANAAHNGAADTERNTALHEMRKAAKRARYVIGAAGPALGNKARKHRKWVKKVQSLLGDPHDTVVARPVLRAFSAKGQLDGADWFTFGVLHAAAHAIEARLPRRGRRSRRRADSEPHP
jgi:CHAD domain-containing protein